jgi:predicted nucleic acid-binding protein
MANKFVLDACAVVALVKDEVGADIVEKILKDVDAGKAAAYMNKLNLFEVFYGVRRDEGLAKAQEVYDMIQRLPIIIIDGIVDEVFLESSRIKSSYRMSLADAIALGEASVMGASLITSDHHEFDVIEENEPIKFMWIRPKST